MLYPLIPPVFFDLLIHGSGQLLKFIEFGLDIVKHLPHLQYLPARSIYRVIDLLNLIGLTRIWESRRGGRCEKWKLGRGGDGEENMVSGRQGGMGYTSSGEEMVAAR